jgi:hypothetical protein
MTIWKYTLALLTQQQVEMPNEASILSCGSQNDEVQIWAMVDSTALAGTKGQKRTLFIVGTGHPLPRSASELRFIGTVQTHNGKLVWHIFELYKK